MADNRSLVLKDTKVLKSALKNIKEELLNEQIEIVRDCIKGAYRLRHEKEKAVEKLQSEIKDIDGILTKTEAGEIEPIKNLKIPAKYLSEKTVRLGGMEWDENEG